MPRLKRLLAAFHVKKPSLACCEPQPELKKIAAERHVFLPAARNFCPRALEADLCLVEPSLHEAGLRCHDKLGAKAVAVRDPIVVRHALVHLMELFLELSRRAVVHHKDRRRPERPAARLNCHGRARHLAAGASVQAAHFGDIVIGKEAHDEVAFAKKVPSFLCRHVRAFRDRARKKRLHLQHLRNLPPRKKPPHQNQKRRRVAHQDLRRARVQPRKQILRRNGRKQVPRVLFNDCKRCVVICGHPVCVQRVQILPVRAVPVSEAVPIGHLRCLRQRAEFSDGALLHHVMEAVVF